MKKHFCNFISCRKESPASSEASHSRRRLNFLGIWSSSLLMYNTKKKNSRAYFLQHLSFQSHILLSAKKKTSEHVLETFWQNFPMYQNEKNAWKRSSYIFCRLLTKKRDSIDYP